MTGHLRWRDAVREDRAALQAFTCTMPERYDRLRRRAAPHPRPWEREVEAGLRRQKPPIGGGRLLLGEDLLGLAAVVLVWFLETEDDVLIVRLAAVAVALRCRGARYGDEAMEVALAAAAEEARDRGARAAYVEGLVDFRNRGSKAMNLRAGLQFYDVGDTEQYERWGRGLPPIVEEPGL